MKPHFTPASFLQSAFVLTSETAEMLLAPMKAQLFRRKMIIHKTLMIGQSKASVIGDRAETQEGMNREKRDPEQAGPGKHPWGDDQHGLLKNEYVSRGQKQI